MIESLRFGGGSPPQAGEKLVQGDAAVPYRFDWKWDVCDGRLRAFHALDMAFSFDNTDAVSRPPEAASRTTRTPRPAKWSTEVEGLA
jgi:hypothetical protein